MKVGGVGYPVDLAEFGEGDVGNLAGLIGADDVQPFDSGFPRVVFFIEKNLESGFGGGVFKDFSDSEARFISGVVLIGVLLAVGDEVPGFIHSSGSGSVTFGKFGHGVEKLMAFSGAGEVLLGQMGPDSGSGLAGCLDCRRVGFSFGAVAMAGDADNLEDFA